MTALDGQEVPQAPLSGVIPLQADSDGPDDSQAAQEAAEHARAKALRRYERTLRAATTRRQTQRALDRLLNDLIRAGGNRPAG